MTAAGVAASAAPKRAGPSPFELDRARKAATRPPEPQSSGANALSPEPAPELTSAVTSIPARERLHQFLHEKGLTHLADAVENSSITLAAGELSVVTPKSYALYFKDRGFEEAVLAVFGRALRLKISIGDASEPAAPILNAASNEDEATGRALANPEVQRFREVFGGEIRKVRNLKE